MRAAPLSTICLAASLLTAACGPSTGAVGSAELNSLFEAMAYPGAELVSQDAWGGPGFGPITTPGNSGSRVYLVSDSPGEVQDHYIALAEKKGWKFRGPGRYEPYTIGHVSFGKYSAMIRTEDRMIAPEELKVPPPPDPYEPPAPEATSRSGSYRLRIDARVG